MLDIVVVDDMKEIRLLVEDMLEDFDCTVNTFSSAKELFDTYKKPYDLLITDLLMPEEDGFSLIMQSMDKFPLAKIIVMSGGAGEMDFLKSHYLKTAKVIGADVALHKPFMINELINAILEVFPSEE